MENNKTTEEIEFEEALSRVPEEIQDFMWSDAFEYILTIAQKAIHLNDEEKKSMRLAAYNLLLRISNMDKEARGMLAEGIEPEKITKILYIIHTQILTAAKNIMNYYTENEPLEEEQSTIDLSLLEIEGPKKTNTVEAPSPADILARLNEKLKKPTAIAPITTHTDTVTEGKSPKPVHPTNSNTPKVFDPYREIPEN